LAQVEQNAEELKGSKPPRYRHTITLGPFLTVHAEDTSLKKAKTRCALNFFKHAQLVYKGEDCSAQLYSHPYVAVINCLCTAPGVFGSAASEPSSSADGADLVLRCGMLAAQRVVVEGIPDEPKVRRAFLFGGPMRSVSEVVLSRPIAIVGELGRWVVVLGSDRVWCS
jgi:hypothetical protein